MLAATHIDIHVPVACNPFIQTILEPNMCWQCGGWLVSWQRIEAGAVVSWPSVSANLGVLGWLPLCDLSPKVFTLYVT